MHIEYHHPTASGSLSTEEKEVCVGRSAGSPADLALNLHFDGSVSRRHARLTHDALDRLAIEDVGSRLGTFVGGADVRGALDGRCRKHSSSARS